MVTTEYTSPYTTTHTVDVVNDPLFEDVAPLDRLDYWKSHSRRSGDGTDTFFVTCSGCAEWTVEQFVRLIKNEISLRNSWRAVLAEDNFITQALRR